MNSLNIGDFPASLNNTYMSHMYSGHVDAEPINGTDTDDTAIGRKSLPLDSELLWNVGMLMKTNLISANRVSGEDGLQGISV